MTYTATADIPNGTDTLRIVLQKAGFSSVAAAVAHHTVFLHPGTVAQTGFQAVFPVVRDGSNKTTTKVLESGQEVMCDDNTTPIAVFRWAAGWPSTSVDLQFNHVIACSSEPRHYTALWNLCVTPAFLAKPTDGHPEVKAALRYRSHELFGTPPHLDEPSVPDDYDDLAWGPVTTEIRDLRATRQDRFTKSHSARSEVLRRLGWLYGEPQPN